jgi:hypothetical protein
MPLNGQSHEKVVETISEDVRHSIAADIVTKA